MNSAPLIITESVTAALVSLRSKAAAAPIDMIDLKHTITTPSGERLHRARMTAQTITIPGPWPFRVTFSIETGHPAGVCRHMSMSAEREGRVPTPEALWVVAKLLGFYGGLESCRGWAERLRDGGVAINVVQPVTVREPAHA